MIRLSTAKYNILKQILQLKEKPLLSGLNHILLNYYDEKAVHFTKDYIYAEGTTPVMLVAHLDTVHPTPPSLLFHDPENKIIWSPQGLGADDRAGVFAIIEIIKSGYRPSILFTTGEETGGHGALTVISDYPNPLTPINFIIELDRQGYNDAVYYDCGNSDFKKFIEAFGFVRAMGTFSDISIIAPIWDVAAVNLSIGYFNEHTRIEFLNYNYMFSTIKKVESILENYGDKVFSFKEIKYNLPTPYPREYEGHEICDSCDRVFPIADLTLVEDIYDHEKWTLCPACLQLNKDIVKSVVE